ncbi:MAG: hypothetical protein WBZ04_12875 [Candidatus Nanopelagicales bacterium]
MPRPPRLLMLTNEPVRGWSQLKGFMNGYELLVDSAELSGLEIVSYRHGPAPEALQRVTDALRTSNAEIVMVLSAAVFPESANDFDQLSEALGDRCLVYWEGDPWGGRAKRMTQQTKWWAARADHIFSVAGPPQSDYLLDGRSGTVNFVPHTYCHLLFADCESEPPPPYWNAEACMIATNAARIPGLTGMPGSFGRRELAERMRRRFGESFRLRGPGWPAKWNIERIEFANQARFMRDAAIGVNWDHFPKHSAYGSDRLAISLIAGRPHVTTSHPQMDWIPGVEVGVFQEESPRAVVKRARELLELGDERIQQIGLEAHRWAAHRISHREAARHVMATVTDSVKPVDFEPWTNLPGPWSSAALRGPHPARR